MDKIGKILFQVKINKKCKISLYFNDSYLYKTKLSLLFILKYFRIINLFHNSLGFFFLLLII